MLAHDSDGSMTITFSEFYEMTRKMKMNLTRERAMSIYASVDENGNDELSLDEFEARTLSKSPNSFFII